MTRVLIVDDKEENRYLLRAMLQGDGYEVDEARHGAEALVKARLHPPRLIISDLLMPVMDGYTLLRRWKADERLNTIPFVVYTATYTEPKDEQLALDLGADAFIIKPAEPEPFLARIRDVMAKEQAGEFAEPRRPATENGVVLKEYSETLIHKLETKTLQLEQANRALNQGITERKRAEEIRSQLLERVITAQENERKRIARELHDGTGQALTSLIVELHTLAETPTLKAMKERACRLRQLTRQALTDVKRLAVGLRPAALDDLGLEPAIRHLADNLAKEHGFKMDIHIAGLERFKMTPVTEITLYRIVQEALTNLAKHAHAGIASVLVQGTTHGIQVIVEDDGRGFDVDAVMRSDDIACHLGLLGMRERVTMSGGTFSIESSPGKGATVYATIPVEQVET